jgi:phosphoglycolate/pyridoxal phosphate phosphatase family enzyme
MDFDGYFFDLDGTILLGEKLLPGVSETLAYLREKGKRIQFLSNTTTRTRVECRNRLQKLGLEAELDEIVTASYTAAVYFEERANNPVVLVVGEPAMMNELDEKGVKQTTDPYAATHVLVGMDQHFDYRKLHQALKAVRNGAALIAANPDPYCPVEDDIIPDTWSMVKAIETASCTQTQAIIGKPSEYYAAKVLEWTGLSRHQCLMIGDRLETDILFGYNNGLHTALVLTGVATKRDAELYPVRPNYIWSSLDELLALTAK